MSELIEDKVSTKVGNRRVHMANERTFLAWIFLVGLGTLHVLLAFIRYRRVERQIDKDTYQYSSILDILLLMAVMSVGIFLVIYLIHST